MRCRVSYAEFVSVSKEIGTLEHEMLELKDSLSEWKSMPSLLHIDESASVAGMLVVTLAFPLDYFSTKHAHQNADATPVLP